MDLNFYITKLNDLELEVLNNYLISLKFASNIDEDNLQYLLITIDKSRNIRFQAYYCLVKYLFDIYTNKYLNDKVKQCFTKHSEIYTNYTNIYNFSIDKNIIENIVRNLKQDEYTEVLEHLHTNFLNTEVTIKNGVFKFENSKINSKNTGSVYTKSNIAHEICAKTIKNKLLINTIINDIKILDFGSGTGRFYFEALKILETGYANSKQDIILNNLYAIDIDEIAINILRLKAINCFQKPTLEDVEILFKNIICKNMLIHQKLSLFEVDNKFFNSNIDFQQVLSNGGFDIIISNPPYAILKVNKKESKKQAYQQYYKELTSKFNNEINYFNKSGNYLYSTEGMLNYYKLSIEAMLNFAKENASFGIICPATLFTDCSSKSLRKYLLLNNKISEIDYYPESANLFNNVAQATVIFYLTKNDKTNNINIKFKNNSFIINIQDIEKSFYNLEIPYIDKVGWDILNKISKFKKLKDYKCIRNKRGELDLTLYKKFITNIPTQFRLVRGNMISKDNGIVDKNNEYVLEEFINNKSNDYLSNDFNKARLICQQISNIDTLKRLNFTISKKSDIIANSCNYLTVENGKSINSLLSIMNSYLLNWRFKISSGNNHINNYELDELPIIEYNQKFKSSEKLDLNIEICKKYNLTDKEIEYILKEYHSEEELSGKLGELVNV